MIVLRWLLKGLIAWIERGADGIWLVRLTFQRPSTLLVGSLSFGFLEPSASLKILCGGFPAFSTLLSSPSSLMVIFMATLPVLEAFGKAILFPPSSLALLRTVLSRILFREVIGKRIAPMVYSVRDNFPSHLLYADDIVLFSRATTTNAEAIKRVLRLYGQLSGQICNQDKSHIYFGKGVPTELRRNITRCLWFHVGNAPMTYLDVPLVVGKPTAAHFNAIKDRILAKFSNWYGSFLSIAGRICLVKSVIQSSAVHSMLIYKWPNSIIHKVDRACRNFIWPAGSIDKKPFQAVRWNTVCSPKDYGGLGVKSFQVMNDSLLAKIAWKIIRGNEFGYRMIQFKYLSNCLIPKNVRILSSIWMGVRKSITAFNMNSFCIEN